MAMLEHPRLTGSLRASYLVNDTFDLAHHQSCRAQALARARLRRSKGTGAGFSWAAFAGGGAAAADPGAVGARAQHKRLIAVVGGMVGAEVSSEELHGAAALVYEVLGRESSVRRARRRHRLCRTGAFQGGADPRGLPPRLARLDPRPRHRTPLHW
ncbi:hypothetical protein T484DRAFT_1908433, partial [Baffinella frigidus]